MGQFTYLGILGACLLITLPLEFLFRARVWRRPRRLFRALWPVVAIFGLWDVAATVAGHWRFNPRLTTGVELPGGVPIDELAFFTVIPVCGLLTLEAVRFLLARLGR